MDEPLDFSGLTSTDDPELPKKKKSTEPVIDFSGLNDVPKFEDALKLEPPLNPMDVTERRRSAKDAFLNAVDSQRQLVNINSAIARGKINPLHFTKDIESLKKQIDPLYEKSGIFLPLPISFNINEEGQAEGFAEDYTLLENNFGTRTKRTFNLALEGVKGMPKAVVDGIMSIPRAAEYQIMLPAMEKAGLLGKYSPLSAQHKFAMQMNLDEFRSKPIEEQNALLDEAGFNTALILLEVAASKVALPLIAARIFKKVNANVGESIIKKGRIGSRERMLDRLERQQINTFDVLENAKKFDSPYKYLAEIGKHTPGVIARLARVEEIEVLHAKVMAHTAGGAASGIAAPLLDRDENTGIKTAIAFGLVGGFLGRHFASKGFRKYGALSGDDIDVIAHAQEIAQMRNLNIAAQASAAHVARTLDALVDNDLSIQNTLVELGKNDNGFTVVPVADPKAVKRLTGRIVSDNLSDDTVTRWEDKFVFFRIDDQPNSMLVRGQDVPDNVWNSSQVFFQRTGMLPNELVSIGGQIAMELKHVELPKAGPRAATNQKLGKGHIGLVMRDPLTGRVAVIPSYAIRRSAGETGQQIVEEIVESKDDIFQAVADAQRSEPEAAMLKIQESKIANNYGWLAEHVGDIINRMSKRPSFYKGGYSEVFEKVDKTLKALEHKYGFEKEMHEQINSNLDFQFKNYPNEPRYTDAAEAFAQLKKLGQKYADAHKQLEPVNLAQSIARDAAVAVGEMDFNLARIHLRRLKEKLDRGPEVWEKYATHYTPKKKTVDELVNDFLLWARSRPDDNITVTTPIRTIANEDIYPNTQQVMREFITGEGEDPNIVLDSPAQPNKTTGTRETSYALLSGGGTGYVEDFRLTGIYQSFTEDDFVKLGKAILGRDMNPLYQGYIDYVTGGTVIRWKNHTRGGQLETPEMTMGHEIFHPIASAIVKHAPQFAERFFRKAAIGDGVHPATYQFAKQLAETTEGEYLDGVTVKRGQKFVQFGETYPTWEKRWEEAITNELGIIATNNGALSTARTARMPIGQLIDEYLTQYHPDKIGLRKAIEHRIAKQMYDDLLDDESKALIANFKNETIETLRDTDAQSLTNEASTMGFYLDNAGSGRIHIRDVWSDEIVATVNDTQSAREFLANSQVPASKPLDVTPDLEMVPEAARSLGGGVMPPSGKVSSNSVADYSMPYEYHKPGWFERLNTFINASAPRFTSMRDYMIALDNTFGTTLFADVYTPTQGAAGINNEARLGWLKRLAKIESQILGMDADSRKLISAFRETMTPDEVIGNYTGRPLNNTEIKYAKQINELGVDLQKIFDYLRKIEQLKSDAGNIGKFDFSGDITQNVIELANQKKKDLQFAIDELTKAMGIDENHKLVASLFEVIKQLDPKSVALGNVVRLARAYGTKDVGPELSRIEFAKKHNMTPAQIKVAQDLDKMYDELAREFEVADHRRITGYMNHYRLFNELPEETTEFLRGLTKQAKTVNQKEFVSQLMRTGELGLFETDPIRSALAYINAGFSNKNLIPVLIKAEKTLTEQIGGIKNRKGRHAFEVVKRYLGELRGIPNIAVEQTQENFAQFLKGLGQDKEVAFRDGLVNTYLTLSNTAALGFRPALAVRDLASWYSAYGSRFGMSRASHGLRLAMKPGVIDELRSKGVLPTIDVVEFLTPAEYVSSGLKSAGDKLPTYLRDVAKFGMTASGQRWSFEHIHAAAYLEVEEMLIGANGLLRQLRRGQISKAKAYKKAFINSYDIPVIKEFDRLVSSDRMEQAAHFLAKATSEETGFVYNLANHPHGWETNTGRILGQFGTYPVWMSRYLTRLASRGTRRELFGVYARFAMVQGAIKGVEKVAGFNLYSWYLSPNFGYAGGPMLHALVDVGAAISTSSDRVREQKLRDLSNLLPFVRYGNFDPTKVGSIFVPGSFAINDWMSAFDLYSSGYNPVTSLGRAFGVAVEKKRRSLLDTAFGSRHPFEY